ncbi:ABC transporter ATP-binding protein [Petroclostridium sp. X23]|uniref:ABC transporter ATP-binding protein n=1 Tax=Petroclostridium sp. X23 TaxID=3045146 RepID=UPI0024AE3E2E|nr:ABC transporter ATP-binding protein [Petroclostridium sp. X23]WHH57808.1 ABC transporter ATP-binding protein [Petroclostridium sp. X23]
MIQVKNLNYTYKKSGKHAVKGIDFNIKKGEIFGFLGPSGAGKSTTQKILIKLLDGYSGDVKVFSRDLSSFNSDYYERVGIGFELPNHFSKLTAKENLEFFKSFYKNQNVDTDSLLKSVGLYDYKDDLVESFSKGMKMRLNFVRAFLNDAELLFFDEPTSGLDPVNSKIVKDLILEQKSKGKTIFVTTHDMQVADALCDRVAFIVDGEIVEMDTPKSLKLKYGLKLVEIEYYVDDKIKSATFDLASYGTNPEFLNIIKNHQTRTIHSMETTLEDVFIKVTGRSLD